MVGAVTPAMPYSEQFRLGAIMSKDDSTIAPGFINYISASRQRFLLPISAAAALMAEADLATEKRAAEKLAIADAAKTGYVESISNPQHENVLALRQLDFDLSSNRTDTKYDLSDAMTIASRLLARSTLTLDRVSAGMSNDLLVAIAMTLAYERGDGN